MSNENKWISIEDELPPINTNILAIREKTKNIFIAMLLDENSCAGFISHWMNIPEPPQAPKPKRTVKMAQAIYENDFLDGSKLYISPQLFETEEAARKHWQKSRSFWGITWIEIEVEDE